MFRVIVDGYRVANVATIDAAGIVAVHVAHQCALLEIGKQIDRGLERPSVIVRWEVRTFHGAPQARGTVEHGISITAPVRAGSLAVAMRRARRHLDGQPGIEWVIGDFVGEHPHPNGQGEHPTTPGETTS